MVPDNKKVTIISYTGILRYDTIGDLINHFKERASEFGINLTLYKKILLVMIESLENILKYNDHIHHALEGNDEYLPFFKLERDSDFFILTSGNPILNTDVSELEERLHHISNLDSEGLKSLYKSTITNGRFSNKGGAGLGFIEMAKIATRKINYQFERVNNHFSYYQLQVQINEEFYSNGKKSEMSVH